MGHKVHDKLGNKVSDQVRDIHVVARCHRALGDRVGDKVKDRLGNKVTNKAASMSLQDLTKH